MFSVTSTVCLPKFFTLLAVFSAAVLVTSAALLAAAFVSFAISLVCPDAALYAMNTNDEITTSLKSLFIFIELTPFCVLMREFPRKLDADFVPVQDGGIESIYPVDAESFERPVRLAPVTGNPDIQRFSEQLLEDHRTFVRCQPIERDLDRLVRFARFYVHASQATVGLYLSYLPGDTYSTTIGKPGQVSYADQFAVFSIGTHSGIFFLTISGH